jgi:hypothetical protein
MGINLRPKKANIKPIDSDKKMLGLLLLASFFDFIGTIVRKIHAKSEEKTKELANRVRSFQMIASSLLCYFTIRIKLYRHQIFTLIIIIVCLLIILLTELIPEVNIPIPIILLTFFPCICRAFLDTIEKYLFDFDNQNPFKILMYEGFINSWLTVIVHFSSISNLKIYKKEKDNEFKRININDDWLLVLFLLLYLILSGLKNLYRVATIKLYSPMTRALTECVFDLGIYIYLICDNNDDNNEDTKGKSHIYYIINIICLIIMAICSLIYNDFIVLYCFGLERDTYSEISKRAKLHLIYDYDDDDDDLDE